MLFFTYLVYTPQTNIMLIPNIEKDLIDIHNSYRKLKKKYKKEIIEIKLSRIKKKENAIR